MTSQHSQSSERQRLPIGIQTFREIREDNHYYVDKTPFIEQLINEGKYYFLSRPRRFGKSLLIDTLAELFEGNQQLFQGLYYQNRWDWTVRYPVIRISFSDGLMESREGLDWRIRDILRVNQERLGVAVSQGLDIPGTLGELIRLAHARYQQRVVILVDEYDKPILDNLANPGVARAMLDGLRNLYSVFKGQDALIRFCMITGVSKFSKVSIFSGLNNLRDITVSPAYSAICGYTEYDLDTVFTAELEGLDRERIRSWYNGYQWTGEAVYNPFNILLFFRERQFKPYWFETGTPSFLIRFLADRQTFTPDLARQYSSFEILSSFDIEDIEPVALLFQAGYITISGTEEYLPGQTLYELGYPNKEVEVSLNNALLPALGLNAQKTLQQRIELLKLLRENCFEPLHQYFSRLFASVPHDWYRNNPIANYEGYYASVFYSHLAALGLDLRVEDTTHHGRIDLTLCFNAQVYLFEFKVVELVPEGKALQQLKVKQYADKYQGRNEPIHLIGVEFSKAQRSVVGFDVETIKKP